NYYSQDKTFYEDGYTYQCDVTEGAGLVNLYNKDSKYIYVKQINRYTGEEISIEQNRLRQFEEETWTKPKCRSIVNNAFSSAEKQRVKGKEFTITMYIDPDTGKVTDVEFIFVTFNSYATIPISVYREMEVEIKKNIWFNITADGKKLNYIVLWWRQEPK
ncbi:DUF5043 domain-containing protein, partial [Bacteroides caecigallinarum]|nr:DUF5043 domain-containing protein [Bacteroides caecigallinarum]